MDALRLLVLAGENSGLASAASALAAAGITTVRRASVEEVEAALDEQEADVVAVRWAMLPGAAAEQELLRRCRSRQAGLLAVLEAGELEGYDAVRGGDDFMVGPPSPEELLARVRQLLWRTRGKDSRRAIRHGELAIDQERYDVSVGGRPRLLTFKEYQLLVLLASNPGRVYTRETLLSRVWGFDYFGGTRTVDVHVRRLRSKIEDAGHGFIETVRNVGYRFRPTPS